METKDSLRKQLFNEIDFKTIFEDANFKEDSVREEIILPILRKLGYSQKDIVRSLTLKSPFLKSGSGKKRKLTLIPDYVLRVGDRNAWVLDAKAPNQKILNDDNVEQVYSYATHPEIRSTYFALCNGRQFAVYRTNGMDIPELLFDVAQIEDNWKRLNTLLSNSSFHTGKVVKYIPPPPLSERINLITL